MPQTNFCVARRVHFLGLQQAHCKHLCNVVNDRLQEQQAPVFLLQWVEGFCKQLRPDVVVDQRTPGSVDQDGAHGHQLDPSGVHQTGGFRACRAMQRQHIGLGDQGLGRIMIDGADRLRVRQRAAVVIVDFHSEAACAGSRDQSNTAHPQNTETFSCDLLAHHEGR